MGRTRCPLREGGRGSMDARWFKSCRRCGGLTGELLEAVCLSFCWRYVPDRLKQAIVVKPVHPFQRGQLHGLLGRPWGTAMNQLGLVEPVARLGQRVVIAVSLTAHRGLDASFCQTFGVPNADVLRAPVGVVNQACCRARVGARIAPALAHRERSQFALSYSRAIPRCAGHTRR